MYQRATHTVPLHAVFYPPRGRSVKSFAEAKTVNTRNLLVIAHGLLGSARNWNAVALKMTKALHENKEFRFNNETVIAAVDLRNHGESPHDPEHNMIAMTADLDRFVEEIVDQSGGHVDRVGIIGHSMGGGALAHALSTVGHPTRKDFVPVLDKLMRAAVVVDICPHCRPQAAIDSVDKIFAAMEKIDMHCPEGMTFSKAERQLKEHGIAEPSLRQFILTNFEGPNSRHPDGPIWKCNFETLNRVVRNGRLFINPLEHPAHRNPDVMTMEENGIVQTPTLFVFGERSPYNNREARKEIPKFFHNVHQVEIQKCGHYVHVENMDAFTAATVEFLHGQKF